MITFRKAATNDAFAIANIHTTNWQENYRGAFSDHYLDHEAERDRLEVWTHRLQQPAEQQHIIVAIDGRQVVGFSCLQGDADATYGTLLNNLHVATGQKGRGIGSELIRRSLDWSLQNYPQRPLYLWILCQNKDGLRFYERHGGKRVEQATHHSPAGLKIPVFRYVWNL